ncbi:replication initiation protein [Pseudomonas typographi]|uniref:replication initiation protein n=1 Tax=Pseudomonas typographi TaxID=2715964 RepID=UPI0016836F2C|nr:replication initiation protein [Pseudomonas typographi]MBD1586005.1 hypothetical protein [Pseudomonas typographi]
MTTLFQYTTNSIRSNALTEKTLETYLSKLPLKPYYTDDYHFGKKIANHNVALKARHIQPNSKTHIYYMLFDVDSTTSAMDWYDLGLPAPHLVVKNPANGHSHLTYILDTSVKADVSGRSKPLNYFSDIELGLAIKMRADLSYNATLTKNPFNADWQTFSFESEPYELGYLNEFVNKELIVKYKDAQKAKEKNAGFSTSRNCQLFEDLRNWAYKNFSSDNFYAELEWQADLLNSFAAPLNSNEVRVIFNSVYSFISKNFSLERLDELKSNRASQSGLKGGGRPVIYERKPWEIEGISSSTYYYRKKNGVHNMPSISNLKPWEKLGIGRTKWYELGKPGAI